MGTMFIDIPSRLRGVEFSRLNFLLELQEPYLARSEALLRLRRELRQAGRQLLAPDRFAPLFDPPPPTDPVARRQVQLPGPPFVLQWPDRLPQRLEAGDVLEVAATFWGEGRQRLGDFAQVMQALGPRGVHQGEGRFELIGIEAADGSGARRPLWGAGAKLGGLAPPSLEAGWYLETNLPVSDCLRLEFCQPARLLSAGRPLFRASFARLFPFILRRVTSMLQAHCGIDAGGEAPWLLARAATVQASDNHLHWQDWRCLAREEENQELGGLTGSLWLRGEALGDLFWLLALGALMNLGKGASFGAGHYLLHHQNRHQAVA
ncbi:MAG: CRISPR system precrRNA processing endoribonuclease RAMP protein Cas6 [Desulfuromonadales bacterium]|nr:CRISPR system precrRNA processing endoribonuclease RAMP protein Cas6 [Desulfuromonadales bacterium]